MATTREQIERLQKEVRRLKIQVAETQRILREHGIAPKNGKRAARKIKRGLSENQRAVEILRRAGALTELTPGEMRRAARWDALPRARKEYVINKLKSVRFNPPLSETIIRDRG